MHNQGEEHRADRPALDDVHAYTNANASQS